MISASTSVCGICEPCSFARCTRTLHRPAKNTDLHDLVRPQVGNGVSVLDADHFARGSEGRSRIQPNTIDAAPPSSLGAKEHDRSRMIDNGAALSFCGEKINNTWRVFERKGFPHRELRDENTGRLTAVNRHHGTR